MVDITAPHAFCRGLPYRSCDTLAGEAADELHSQILSRGIASHEFKAYTPRAECDLNRDACYEHQYRQEVRSHIQEDRGVRIVLDVHSYPADYSEWGAYEIVVLDDYTDSYRPFATGLYEHIKSRGAVALFAQGIHNSIQDEFNRGKIRSTLIEFREDLDHARLSQLCSMIADYVSGGMDHKKQNGTNLCILYRTGCTRAGADYRRQAIQSTDMSRGRDFAYGEVVSYAPDYRIPTVLSITQAVSLGFFFVTLIFFLLETQHVRFINVYIYTVVYGVVGAVLILILQPIGFIGYMWRNRIRNPSKRVAAGDDHSFMGAHHTREVVIGLLSSIIGFLAIMWLLINWLNRFNKTCCTSADSDPATVVGGDLLTADELTMALFMQWRVFYAAFSLSAFISVACTVWMFRSTLAHFNPLRVVTQIYNATS